MQTIAEIAALAAQTAAQDQDTSVGFERELPAEGKTGLRFIEYIELGFQKQPDYAGKPKPPAMVAMLGFELLGKKYIHEIEVNGEKKIIADKITKRVAVKLSDRATFRKIWNKMVYGRPDMKHMAEMLGEAFLGEVTHNTAAGKDGKPGKTYANLATKIPDGKGGFKTGEFSLSAPYLDMPEIGEDGQPTGETVKTSLKVREALSPLRIFIFDNPTKETWDSLFIDGYNEVKVDGVDVKQSKNWIQETIVGSTKYPGSALEALLHEVGGLSIDPEVAPATAEVDDDEPPFDTDETPASTSASEKAPAANGNVPPAAAKAQAAATTPAKTSATGDAAAALAALGLDADAA